MPTDTNYYPDVGSEPTADTPPPESEGMESKDTSTESDETESESDDVGDTALIPKSVVSGKDLKPGDTITFTVEHIYDDEIEVCAYKNKKPKESMTADEEIDGMMKG